MMSTWVSFDANSIKGYHAHVYFRNNEERKQAEVIRHEIVKEFDVELGRWREMPVGPHPEAMYQVSFSPEDLGAMIPWLMSVRGTLSILVHASTGVNDYVDHTTGACWLGEQLPLNLTIFANQAGISA